jgi:hypothetical protein
MSHGPLLQVRQVMRQVLHQSPLLGLLSLVLVPQSLREDYSKWSTKSGHKLFSKRSQIGAIALTRDVAISLLPCHLFQVRQPSLQLQTSTSKLRRSALQTITSTQLHLQGLSELRLYSPIIVRNLLLSSTTLPSQTSLLRLSIQSPTTWTIRLSP